MIPEYLLLLNGVIDCPDIPLNVSRSFLQNDRQVQKISKHITKKVSDKLTGLYKSDREKFEACWNDISVFVKLGCIKDEDFYSRVKDCIIYKDLNGKYCTLAEFVNGETTPITKPVKENAEEEAAEKREDSEAKEPTTIYYISDEVGQAQYIHLFRESGLNAIICDTFIDPHFLSYLEFKESGKYRFLRIDADIDAALKEGATDAETNKALTEAFRASLNNTTISVKAEMLKSTEIPAVINVSEMSRRFGEMNAFYGLAGANTDRDMTLIINTANPVIQAFMGLEDEKKKFVANQVYYLAMLSYKKLSPEEMKAFSDNSVTLLREWIR